jgi:hypothetical protein
VEACSHLDQHDERKTGLGFLDGHKELSSAGQMEFSTRFDLTSGGLSRSNTQVEIAVVHAKNADADGTMYAPVIMHQSSQGLYEDTKEMSIDYSKIKFKARGAKFTLLFSLDGGSSGSLDFGQEGGSTYVEVQVKEKQKDGSVEVHQCLRFDV